MLEFRKICLNLFRVHDGQLIRNTSVSPNALAGSVAGSIDGNYRRVKINRKSYLVHRIIFLMIYGYLPDLVDHIDGDTFNNDPAKLRESTKLSNRWNCKENSGSISGIKGVYWDRGKWKALVNFKGNRYYLGMFSDKFDAEKIVKAKYSELQGEFSYKGK